MLYTLRDRDTYIIGLCPIHHALQRTKEMDIYESKSTLCDVGMTVKGMKMLLGHSLATLTRVVIHIC